MSLLDLLLLIVGVLLVLFMATQRFIRALIMIFGVYLSTLIAALLYKPVADRLSDLSRGAPNFLEGTIFIILLALMFIIYFFVMRASFPDTDLPKLKVVDNILGGVVGVVVAALFMSAILSAVGWMVNTPWDNYNAYAALSATYAGSAMRAALLNVMYYYSSLFYPFFIEGFPPVLRPR